MKLYSENKEYKLYQGNMLEMLEVIEPNSIDSIVTDPPYELNFMNKGWDNSGVAFQKSTWEKCFTVLKPGGYLLAFGGSRTFHRIACAIEDAGFEIRDTIIWLYGSGFPKSMNLGLAIDKKNGVDNRTGEVACGVNKHSDSAIEGGEFSKYYEERKAQNEWAGWGTSLKPSYEPIVVARKPCDGSCIDNVLKYGVGGINIDECRVAFSEKEPDGRVGTNTPMATDKMWFDNAGGYAGDNIQTYKNNGRFPANTILTYDETDFEEVCGGFPYTKNSGAPLTMPDLRDVGKKSKDAIGIDKLSFGQVRNAKRKPYVYAGREYNNKDTSMFNGDKPQAPSNYADDGSASRYFYCAKASKKDRDEGLSAFETKQCVGGGGGIGDYLNDVNSASGKFGSEKAPHKNIHPTVKPTTLMQYLIRLVTPNGGTILDPFNGSGSTGKAAMYENRERGKDYKYIGIELTEEYLPISRARIEYAQNGGLAEVFEDTPTEKKELEHKTVTKAVSLW